MKNHNPAGQGLRFASAGQRLGALFVFAVMGYLIWLAFTGRYDAQVNQFAAWLSAHYRDLTR